MSSIFHCHIGNHLGFHGTGVNSPNGVKSIIPNPNEAAFSSTEWNLSVALNMIPLIGNFLVGFVHFAIGCNPDLPNPLLRKRGIVEMTIVGGMVLAIADIVVTIGRMSTDQPKTAESS